MKGIPTALIRVLSGLLALGLLTWGVIEGIGAVADYLRSLQSDVASAFVVAALAVVGSVISLAVGKAYETRAAINSDLRQKKTPVYEGITKVLFGVVFNSILKKPQIPEAELLEFFASTTEKLTIWGSDDVLKAYSEFKTNAASDPQQSIFRFEALLLAIRKDLGHRNKDIGKGSILRLFVNDLDEHMRKPAQQTAAAAGASRRS